MAAQLIVSYDGTSNDDDAIALAKLLARAGASLALAYVRHSREFDPQREELAQHDAERRLDQGAELLGRTDAARHIVVSASTGEGLVRLAEQEGASIIVFGSDYRTPPGHAEPGNTAQQLLEGGTVPVAVAAAGLRAKGPEAIATIAFGTADTSDAAENTANALAGVLGATIVPEDSAEIDLLVVGSTKPGPPGRIALSGPTRSMLSAVRASVLVLPWGHPIQL